MHDLLISHVRTYVPIGVGAFLTWLADRFGIVGVDSAAASSFAVSLVSALYYAVARVLEGRFPAAGILLGSPKPPVYDTDPVIDAFVEELDALAPADVLTAYTDA